jgi:hypothetical protein
MTYCDICKRWTNQRHFARGTLVLCEYDFRRLCPEDAERLGLKPLDPPAEPGKETL